MRLIKAIAISSLLSACASTIEMKSWDSAITTQVKLRSAFEFDCDKDEIEITKITSKSYGAEGCGQKGVYVVSGPAHCTPRYFTGDEAAVIEVCPVVLNTDIDQK